MRIIMNVKEQKEQWKTFVKITARLDISPEDSIAEINTGTKVFERIKASLLADGGGVNEDGSAWLCK